MTVKHITWWDFIAAKRRPDHNPEKTTIKYILFIKCRQLLTNYF